ncbi:hypothetical protein M3J09_010636 [Ascochyta lentis]
MELIASCSSAELDLSMQHLSTQIQAYPSLNLLASLQTQFSSASAFDVVEWVLCLYLQMWLLQCSTGEKNCVVWNLARLSSRDSVFRSLIVREGCLVYEWSGLRKSTGYKVDKIE